MSDDDDLDLEEEAVDSDGLTIPVVPGELDVDPLLLALLQCAAFLDFAADDTIDSQAAGDVLEHVSLYVQRLSADQLGEIQDQLDALEEHGRAAGWPSDIVEFVRDFLYNCGIGEDEDEDEDAPGDGD